MKSILDTDLYKFTTAYAYMKLFPKSMCTFTFKDRNKVKRTPEFLKKYKEELDTLKDLRFTDEEYAWCVYHIPEIPVSFWQWLKGFHYSELTPYLDEEGILNVSVTDYTWKASLYEIPTMSSIPEVNNRDKKINYEKLISDLDYKIALSNNSGMKFAEFGTRRRFNYEVQDIVIKRLKEKAQYCVGTSNVYLAMKYGMKPIGTHPHEWFMFHGAQFGYRNANRIALQNWLKVYNGNLAVALTDTYTSDVFFRNFTQELAKAYDGLRQDSGDEIEFINKAIGRYSELGIDYTKKSITFSNALDFPKAIQILNYCTKKGINANFGIGTNLTCDVYSPEGEKYPAENIVMKMSKCMLEVGDYWVPTIKISDDLGKHMGNDVEFNIASAQLYLNSDNYERI